MEETQSQKASDRAKVYEDLIWRDTFTRHGIDEKYHRSWFFNYEAVTDQQKTNLAIMVASCRRNTSLALLGSVGNGKTHLATTVLKDSIICNSSKLKRECSAGHYYTLADLHRQYRDSMSNKDASEADFMKNICTMKCLVIDEIQIKSDSDSEQRMFQEIIDKRYSNNKQTIYVGNISFKRFSEILGDRLMDRLKENGFKAMVFTGESYRGKKSENGEEI